MKEWSPKILAEYACGLGILDPPDEQTLTWAVNTTLIDRVDEIQDVSAAFKLGTRLELALVHLVGKYTEKKLKLEHAKERCWKRLTIKYGSRSAESSEKYLDQEFIDLQDTYDSASCLVSVLVGIQQVLSMRQTKLEHLSNNYRRELQVDGR